MAFGTLLGTRGEAMKVIKTSDPAELDGYSEWVNGGPCPWYEIQRGVWQNDRTQQTFRWRPGQVGVLEG